MSVLRKRSRSQADVGHHIRHELAELMPILRIEQCAIELRAFDPASGTAVLFIKGGCPDCNCSPATFRPPFKITPKRTLEEDMQLQTNVMSYAGSSKVISVPKKAVSSQLSAISH